MLNFDTPLGKFILHNMQILDTDWCPVEAMRLSKNSYFIFKRFILNASAGKRRSETIDIKFDALRSFLDFNGANIGGIFAAIKKALDELTTNQLIIGYRIRETLQTTPLSSAIEKQKGQCQAECRQKERIFKAKLTGMLLKNAYETDKNAYIIEKYAYKSIGKLFFI
jgi:hypothetical protein